MARYIKQFGRIGFALGPSEERGFSFWAGYDLVGVNRDLRERGLIAVDDWPPEKLAEYGVTGFTRVEPGDVATYDKLGIGRDDDD